jgi:hypothetical protein
LLLGLAVLSFLGALESPLLFGELLSELSVLVLDSPDVHWEDGLGHLSTLVRGTAGCRLSVAEGIGGNLLRRCTAFVKIANSGSCIWLARLMTLLLRIRPFTWWKQIESSKVFAHHWRPVVTGRLKEIGEVSEELCLVLGRELEGATSWVKKNIERAFSWLLGHVFECLHRFLAVLAQFLRCGILAILLD